MKRIPGLALMLMATVPATASATIIDVIWSGTVSSSNVTFISVGDAASGNFSYNTVLPIFQNNAPTNIVYDGDVTSFFSIGSFSGSLADQNVNIFDNVGAIPFDQFSISAPPPFDPATYSGDAFDGRIPVQLNWILGGPDSVLSDLSIPGDELDVLPWNAEFARLDTVDAVTDEFFFATALIRINEFTATASAEAVEPSTLALLGIGLVGLGRMGRIRRPRPHPHYWRKSRCL